MASLLRERYRPADVAAVADLLRAFGVFDLHARPNGLYAAVPRAAPGAEPLGYERCWVRDCVHVANAAWEAGQTASAGRTAASLLAWFEVQRPRFQACIDGRADPSDKMQRPHVRFDGDALTELPERWPHAQNDALGYGLWFLCRAVLAGLLPLDDRAVATLSQFPPYFAAIGYWRDADSGHWEETPKLEASSVGTVLAGLRALSGLVRAVARRDAEGARALAGGADLDALMEAGKAMLSETLPWESRPGHDPAGGRRADAALLFLIHPLRVVDRAQTDAILAAVRAELEGPFGIRRYVGDSYWMADYKRLFDAETRTSGFDDDVQRRDRHLQPGTEAQWCLFDPLLATIHGWRHVATGEEAERALMVHHANRALGQITGEDCPLGAGLCPEAYYLEDALRPERWVANDDTPLLWTQAHLLGAVLALERSAGREG